LVADQSNLAELLEDLHAFVSIGVTEHGDHLLDDLLLAFDPLEEGLEHRGVAFNAGLQMLETLLGPTQDCLHEDGTVLNDLEELLGGLPGQEGVSDDLELRVVGGGGLECGKVGRVW